MAIQGWLLQSSAATIKLGPFVDKGDGVAYEVGMAAAMNHADTGVRISKNGGALAARNTATIPVYDAFGYYLVNLDTTDVGTVGRLKVIFGDAAVCLPCEADFEILPANVYNALMGTDLLDVNAAQWLGTAILAPGVAGTPDVNAKQIGSTAQTAGDIVAAIITNAAGTDVAADIIALKTVADGIPTTAMRGTDSAALASVCTEARLQALTDWLNGGRLDLLLDAIPTTAMRGTDSAALASVATEGRLAELDAANLPTDVDAIQAKTDNLPEGIQKNQAFSNFEFLMIDSTDHISPKTGLTVACTRSIDGAAFAPIAGSTAEVSSGMYQADFLAADTNGDVITYRFTAAGADDRFVTIRTTT